MTILSRRRFLGSSLAGLGGLTGGSILGADGKPAAYRPENLLLTWFRDPTTTMVVQWIGKADAVADTAIHYRQVPRGLTALLADAAAEPAWNQQPATTRPFPMTDLTHFRVELSGLMPGTDYTFCLAGKPPYWRFRTAPAKATNTFTFVSGGDCGVNEATITNNIQAARQDPVFALIGGDLAYENGRDPETFLAFLRNYSQHTVAAENRLVPMLACIGNHEVDGAYDQPRSKAPFFYALFDGLFRETGYATLEFGDYLSLILLDSGHTSPIAGAQTDWLAQRLRERREHPHVFAVNHVPCYPSARAMFKSDGSPGTGGEQREHWTPLFDRYRVPVVLEHHDHTFKRSRPLLGGREERAGVLYLGDGSWGRLRALQPPEKLGHLAVYSSEYHVSVHRIEGDERFHVALDRQGRVMDVCRTGQRPA